MLQPACCAEILQLHTAGLHVAWQIKLAAPRQPSLSPALWFLVKCSRGGVFCSAGDANPDEGFCYPLIVQDQDMRTVLEIKPPGEGKQQQQDAIGHVAVEGPITVPMIKVSGLKKGFVSLHCKKAG